MWTVTAKCPEMIGGTSMTLVCGSYMYDTTFHMQQLKDTF